MPYTLFSIHIFFLFVLYNIRTHIYICKLCNIFYYSYFFFCTYIYIYLHICKKYILYIYFVLPFICKFCNLSSMLRWELRHADNPLPWIDELSSYYEWARRTKFLSAVIYGSSRRLSNSSKNFKENLKKLKSFFMVILRPA